MIYFSHHIFLLKEVCNYIKTICAGIVGIRFAAEFHCAAYLSAERRGTEVEIMLNSTI